MTNLTRLRRSCEEILMREGHAVSSKTHLPEILKIWAERETRIKQEAQRKTEEFQQAQVIRAEQSQKMPDEIMAQLCFPGGEAIKLTLPSHLPLKESLGEYMSSYPGLYYQDQYLGYSLTPAELGFPEVVPLTLTRQRFWADYEETPITLKTLTGQSYPIPISSSHSIEILKKRIHQITKVPPDQMRLIHRSRQLEDARTLKEYRILPYEIINLVLRLRGGMYHVASGVTDLIHLKPYLATPEERIHTDFACDRCHQADFSGLRYHALKEGVDYRNWDALDGLDFCAECWEQIKNYSSVKHLKMTFLELAP